MLMEYIEQTYTKGEPIFLNELPCKSLDSLRQEMKKLTDEGKLIRVYNGVYYQPFKTILGTDGKMSIDKYIEKKYLIKDDKICGYFTGLALYNKYGFTTQIPSIIEVSSNEATTKQRKLIVDNYNIIVHKPIFAITNDNINELKFLDLMTNIDRYSELSKAEKIKKLNQYIQINKIDFNKVKMYLPKYPDKIYRNIYEGGLMGELV